MFKFSVRMAVLACFLVTAGEALAEGFALYEYSARGVALSGAVMARKADPSAVAYNPALLTQLSGIHAMAGVSAIYPRGTMKWHDENLETSRLKHSLWYIPHAYYTHQLNDDWYFGVGEFTRYGLGFEYPHDWPGRFNIYEVALSTFSINPVLAWKATSKLSVAAGVEVVYVNLDLKKRSQVDMVPGVASFEVDANIQDADAWGVGGNIAAHYQFNEQWAIGAQYRSQVRVHAYGDMQYTYKGYTGPEQLPLGPGGAAVPGGAVAEGAYRQNFRDGQADSTVVLPDSLALGIAWMPVPQFSIEVGAIWTRWSTFKALNINLPSPIGKAESPKDWRDTWRFNIGVEWDVLEWLTLRAGYTYDQAPMTEQYADYLVPTANRNIYSGGLGFKWEAWTLDLAYSIIVPKERNYNTSEKTNTLRSKPSDSYTQIFALSLGYEF